MNTQILLYIPPKKRGLKTSQTVSGLFWSRQLLRLRPAARYAHLSQIRVLAKDGKHSQLRANMLSYGFVGGLKHHLDGDKNNPPKKAGGMCVFSILSPSLVIERCVNILPTWREETLKLQPAGLLSMETFELWSPLGDVKKMRRLGCPIYVLRICVHSCGSIYVSSKVDDVHV